MAGNIKTAGPTKRPCGRCETLIGDPNGEYVCLPRERFRSLNGSACPDGYVLTEDENRKGYCVPCQEVEVDCLGSGSTTETIDICPGGRSYCTEKDKADIFLEVDAAISKILDRHCTILTPGHFYNRAQELVADRAQQQQEAKHREKITEELRTSYVPQLKEKRENGKVVVERRIRVEKPLEEAPPETTELGLLPTPRGHVLPIRGEGPTSKEAKENWIQNAVNTVIAKNLKLVGP